MVGSTGYWGRCALVGMDVQSGSFGSSSCAGHGWMLKSFEKVLVVELALETESTILPSGSLQSLFGLAKDPSPSPPALLSLSLWRVICLPTKFLNHRSKV